MANKELQRDSLLLWKDLLDLGIESSLAFLQKKRTKQVALKELKTSLFRQSEEHWQGLYNALKKLK